MHRQEFEKHPKLAESIQNLALTQTVMSLTEWNDFIENLCAALVDGDAALKAENARLMTWLGSMVGYAKWQISEGGSHHPTLPSAVEAAQSVLDDIRRRAALGEDQ